MTMMPSIRTVFLIIFVLAPNSVSAQQACDETLSISPLGQPLAERIAYQLAKRKFPLVPVGQCGGVFFGDPAEVPLDLEFFPASPARPALWERYMFGVDPNGQPYKNFLHHDLPIIDTYYDKDGRPVDVYETMTTATPLVNLFQSDSNPVDTCKPLDYVQTNGFFLYGSVSVPHYTPAPTIKNCLGRQGVVRFENRATRAPISIHLHGSATVAAYDGWADDVTDVNSAKNYFYPNSRPST
jgi:hypothetical protein